MVLMVAVGNGRGVKVEGRVVGVIVVGATTLLAVEYGLEAGVV